MSASRCSKPPLAGSPLPRRTSRTLASGPCGPGDAFSIIGCRSSVTESDVGDLLLDLIADVQPVIQVAPSPVLAWLSRPDHRVARLLEVCRGMAIRAQVAAARPAAGQALPEMFPPSADLDARGADGQRRVALSEVPIDLDMLARLRLVPARVIRVARRHDGTLARRCSSHLAAKMKDRLRQVWE